MQDEEKTERVNARLGEIAAEIRRLAQGWEHIRPAEAAEVVVAALELASISRAADGGAALHNAIAGLEMRGLAREEIAAEIIGLTPEGMVADLLLQIPWTEGGPTARPNRNLALEATDVLGPDWGQALYHFAVLVTKLAAADLRAHAKA